MADIDVLMPLIKQFMPFAKEQMGFNRPPKLFLKGDSSNAADPLGKTGFYDPQAESITLYITARHPKDILRSLSHELMHHTQNCRGDFTDTGEMGEGYAQNNPHMRNMEIEAYKASICFRDWEDSLRETIYYEHLQKGDKTMSTKDWKNGEIKTLLSEAWGFKMDLNKLNEGTEGAEEKLEEDSDEEVVEENNSEDAGEEKLEEDSGEEEKRHYEDDDWHDKDRLDAILHHADELRKDMDHDHDHEELEEMCGPEAEHGAEVVVMGDEEGVVGDEAADPASRVAALMDELKSLLLQLAGGAGGEEVTVEEPMEEGGLANRKGDPRNKRPEASPVREDKLRALVRKAIKEAMK